MNVALSEHGHVLTLGDTLFFDEEEFMTQNRIRSFFASGDRFREIAITSPTSEERAVSTRTTSAGKSQVVYSQKPQRAQSPDNLPLRIASDATRPLALSKGWCNYSI
jgi:hypothetical protein